MKIYTYPMLLGLIATTAASLSVHAVMLEHFHVPYPYSYPNHGWPIFPDKFVAALAAVYVLPLLDARFQRLSLFRRWVMFFLLLATIDEALFRAPFMDIMNSRSITYPIVQAMPRLFQLAITSGLVIGLASNVRAHWAKWTAAFVISAFVFICSQSLIHFLFDKLLTRIAWMASPSLYDPPYDYHILIPAYLSFLEPVLATFFMAGLIWDRLPDPLIRRIVVFTLLVLGLKGPVTKPFINIVFAGISPGTAMLSEAQFSFETIALGLLTALTWSIATRCKQVSKV